MIFYIYINKKHTLINLYKIYIVYINSSSIKRPYYSLYFCKLVLRLKNSISV